MLAVHCLVFRGPGRRHLCRRCRLPLCRCPPGSWVVVSGDQWDGAPLACSVPRTLVAPPRHALTSWAPRRVPNEAAAAAVAARVSTTATQEGGG